MASILIVDDDHVILSLLQRFLVKSGYDVDTAESAVAMDQRMSRHEYDLVVLDVMLPGEDGLSICRRLRSASGVAIIMVTGVTEPTDRVVGLELGADDYVAKPFNARELLARIRAVLRRKVAQGPIDSRAFNDEVVFAGWTLDRGRRELRSSDQTLISLSGGEYDLLVTFTEHPQRVLTRDQLIDMSRGPATDKFDRSIDVQVSRLRRKIEPDAKSPELIRTVRNGGYMFAVDVVRRAPVRV